MKTGEKIAKLRREHNYTQEQLADLLGVSRQSISKYESGISYPETEKLIHLSELFGCSLDYLLKDNVEDRQNTMQSQVSDEELLYRVLHGKIHFEKKSKKIIFGMPLWHIGKNAKGFFAIGFRAKGVVSIGLLSRGVISIGMLSLGILSNGLFTLGLLSAGCISAGILSTGAISLGIISIGAIAVGEFSIGALAIGHYYAYGDYAKAMFAVGKSHAFGEIFEKVGELSHSERQEIIQQLINKVPKLYQWIVRWLV